MKCSIGQDSHLFTKDDRKELILGGVFIHNHMPLKGNSDADVILHSLTNAVSGITGVNILGEIADDLCLRKGIKDSKEYVREALKYMSDYKITHVSFSIECKTPRLSPYIEEIKESISELLSISPSSVGITATSGEGLTSFGKGLGIMSLCILTVE
ncbi:MAG: 2-C-methyl-D-erythritol 2,4-cyclodiphosphate synthase [Clostridia bacterium]|nr:2-C-methyl-D-erythritol 2,4-cyclodiphosphate synthase [Clostridia bacterium]